MGPIEQTRAGETGSIIIDRLHGSLPNLGMNGESQIVVGAQHDDFFAFYNTNGTLITVNRFVIRIYRYILTFLEADHG